MENVPVYESRDNRQRSAELTQGAKARVKRTGQVVDVVRVSDHGISVVVFCTGEEYFMSNKFLEPLNTIH